MMGLGPMLLLVFSIEFIAAGRPFQQGAGLKEMAFLLLGIVMLSVWHSIIWERSGDDQ